MPTWCVLITEAPNLGSFGFAILYLFQYAHARIPWLHDCFVQLDGLVERQLVQNPHKRMLWRYVCIQKFSCSSWALQCVIRKVAMSASSRKCMVLAHGAAELICNARTIAFVVSLDDALVLRLLCGNCAHSTNFYAFDSVLIYITCFWMS